MIAKDKEMRKINQKIERAMKETVDVSLLSSRVFQKYQKYINSQVERRKDDLLIP